MQDIQYKPKYLKYKRKYLLAKEKQYGGGILQNAIILTKLDLIKSLDPQLQNLTDELPVSVKCMDLENILRTELGNKAHLIKDDMQMFVKFTKDQYICGETHAKKIGSDVTDIAKPVLSDIKKTTQEQLKQSVSAITPQIQQSIQTGISSAINVGTQKATEKIGKIGSKPQQSGGINVKIVLDLVKRVFKKDLSETDVSKIITENNYDVAIKYSQQLIGKSKITVLKLN